MAFQRATVLLLTILASNSMAASFDCTQAKNFAETEICRDGYLSRVDDILSRNYKALLDTTGQQDALRKSQRDWLTTRDQCTTQKCLDQALGARIKALNDLKSDEIGKRLEFEQQQQMSKSQAQDAERARRAREVYVADEQAYQHRLQAAQHQTLEPKLLSNESVPPNYQASESQTARQPQRPARLVNQEETFWKHISGIGWKCALILAILLSGWAVARHRRGVATIYNDYTDAAITNSLPISGLLIGLICGWLGMPHQIFQIVVSTGVLLGIFYALYAAFKTNKGGFDILLTTIAKLTLVFVFYVIIGLLVLSFFGGARRKGESLTQAETRRRREARLARVQIVAASTGYSFFTSWLCRHAEFTPFSECFQFHSTSNSN